MRANIETLARLEKGGLAVNRVSSEIRLGSLTTRTRNAVVRGLEMLIIPYTGQAQTLVTGLTAGYDLPLCMLSTSQYTNLWLDKRIVERNMAGAKKFLEWQTTLQRLGSSHARPTYYLARLHELHTFIESGGRTYLNPWTLNLHVESCPPAVLYDMVIKDAITEAERAVTSELIAKVKRGEVITVQHDTLL